MSAQREGATIEARIDLAALESIAVAARAAAVKAGLAPPTMDGLLALRGVVEAADVEDDEAAMNAACAGALASVDEAIAALTAARRWRARRSPRCSTTGSRPSRRWSRPPTPIRRAGRRRCASASPRAFETLMASSRGFDENRLHQEAILLAAKADIREELDRLKTHVAAARALIEEGGPIGRRLDFLAQELAREASTLCAKANDVSLTAQGLELRAQIEQFREQVQNVE